MVSGTKTKACRARSETAEIAFFYLPTCTYLTTYVYTYLCTVHTQMYKKYTRLQYLEPSFVLSN